MFSLTRGWISEMYIVVVFTIDDKKVVTRLKFKKKKKKKLSVENRAVKNWVMFKY